MHREMHSSLRSKNPIKSGVNSVLGAQMHTCTVNKKYFLKVKKNKNINARCACTVKNSVKP